MEPNTLLPACRAEFLQGFVSSVNKAIPKTAEALFKRADASYTSIEQSLYLGACHLLHEPDKLIDQVSRELDSLLTRSFQTTYNSFRPRSALNQQGKNLALMEAHVLENELQLNEVTDMFRNEAEDEIRDLNIRVALLFAQEAIKERENPFRPYLLARCLANATATMSEDGKLTTALGLELAHQVLPFIPEIYEKVNQYLAANGVAAELQFKLKRPAETAAPAAPEREATSYAEESAGVQNAAQGSFHGSPQGFPPAPQAAPSGGAIRSMSRGFASRFVGSSLASALQASIGGFSTAASRSDSLMAEPAGQADIPGAPGQIASAAGEAMAKIGHLLNTVRQIAMSMGSHTSHAPDHSAVHPSAYGGLDAAAYAGAARLAASSPTDMPAGGAAFSWLPENQNLGVALRGFFNSGSISGRANGSVITESLAQPADATSGGEHIAAAADADFPETQALSQESLTTTADGTATAYPERHGIVHSVHLLQKRMATPVENMYDSGGGIRNLILEERQTLNDMTSDVDEQMTIDVVAMLFEFILSDPQVPAEIRAQLGRLQFLVLKIALREPTLLTQKGHPARMLINRIGSISLGLKKIDPTGVHIADEICRIVETLLQDDNENSQLFSRMLDEFDAFIAKELRESDSRVAEAAEAVEDTQHRTLRLLHIQAQLQEVTQNLTIDPYLKDFLFLHWMSVIELAERNDMKRGLRYRLLVPDLLWSIVPKTADEDRTQLFALLPIILNTIREGLSSLGWDSTQQKDLLDWLVDAHTAALRAGTVNSKSLALPSIHEHFSKFTYANAQESDMPANRANEPETQRLLSEAIRDLDLKVDMLDQLVEQDLAASPDQAVDEEQVISSESIRERLRSGIGIELKLGVKPSTGKVNWMDGYLNQLLLSLNGHEQPSLISVRMFRRMIAHGRVRFLEVEPLFERAVQALLTTADAVDTPAAVPA